MEKLQKANTKCFQKRSNGRKRRIETDFHITANIQYYKATSL